METGTKKVKTHREPMDVAFDRVRSAMKNLSMEDKRRLFRAIDTMYGIFDVRSEFKRGESGTGQAPIAANQ
jgi:hypothetical protein